MTLMATGRLIIIFMIGRKHETEQIEHFCKQLSEQADTWVKALDGRRKIKFNFDLEIFYSYNS